MYDQFKIQPKNTAPIQKQSALHHKHYKIKFANLLIQGEKGPLTATILMNTKYPPKTAYSPVLNRIAVTVTFNSDLHFPPDHFDHSLFRR